MVRTRRNAYGSCTDDAPQKQSRRLRAETRGCGRQQRIKQQKKKKKKQTIDTDVVNVREWLSAHHLNLSTILKERECLLSGSLLLWASQTPDQRASWQPGDVDIYCHMRELDARLLLFEQRHQSAVQTFMSPSEPEAKPGAFRLHKNVNDLKSNTYRLDLRLPQVVGYNFNGIEVQIIGVLDTVPLEELVADFDLSIVRALWYGGQNSIRRIAPGERLEIVQQQLATEWWCTIRACDMALLQALCDPCTALKMRDRMDNAYASEALYYELGALRHSSHIYEAPSKDANPLHQYIFHTTVNPEYIFVSTAGMMVRATRLVKRIHKYLERGIYFPLIPLPILRIAAAFKQDKECADGLDLFIAWCNVLKNAKLLGQWQKRGGGNEEEEVPYRYGGIPKQITKKS